MTSSAADEMLLRHTDAALARPLPDALRMARLAVAAAIGELAGIADAELNLEWGWKGGSDEEVRYGFYRINEAFERAGIDADEALRASGMTRGRAGDLIGPATAARWDLHGLLVGLDDGLWDADPGGGEWTIRQALGHIITSQRGYGVGTAWWQAQAYHADDPDLPASPPGTIFDVLPSEEDNATGSPAEVRDRMDLVLDLSTERLAGLPEERLGLGGRWAGFAVDVGFRIGRWSSHIREHTIQVEKTLLMLDHRPTEVQRLLRLVLASWGRAEAVVFGTQQPHASLDPLATAAAGAQVTAAEIAQIAATSRR